MKLIILYLLGLVLAWLGLNAILVAVAHWGQAGAMVPLLSGGIILLVAIWFLLGAVRLYLRPSIRQKRGSSLVDL